MTWKCGRDGCNAIRAGLGESIVSMEQMERYRLMESTLRNAREKLVLYREAHTGEYLGGVEYTTLMRSIDAALTPSGDAGVK